MFTPVETAAGAILLHIATTVLLFDTGAILGVSGILRRLLTRPREEISFQSPRSWFIVGLAVAVTFTTKLLPSQVPDYPRVEWTIRGIFETVGSGALTGWGTMVSRWC
jgi:hypothetical protein